MRVRMRTDREGVAIVLVAVMMIALLATMSLGVELGMAYVGKTDAQKVADSAALAGASAFLDFTSPYGPAEDTADARARNYAARNVVRARPVDPVNEVTVQVIPDSQKVRVWVEKGGLPTWFARLLGWDSITVRAMAAAEARWAGSSSCVKPFAIQDRWDENLEDGGDDGNDEMDFDNVIPCNGVTACAPNEVWEYNPELGDRYEPINEGRTNLSTATGWGSGWLDPDGQDAGARILITPQSAQGTATPGWYSYWQMPDSTGSSQTGARNLTDAIKGCVDLNDIGIGDEIDPDGDLQGQADPQTGNIGKPVYDAVREVLDSDPDIEWDASTNEPYYPAGTPSAQAGTSVWSSPRVWTVVLVHPGDIQTGSSHSMRIVDFATVFLEDPVDMYGGGGGNAFKYPIWGRLIHYGAGTVGPQSGNLQKVLRLVE